MTQIPVRCLRFHNGTIKIQRGWRFSFEFISFKVKHNTLTGGHNRLPSRKGPDVRRVEMSAKANKWNIRVMKHVAEYVGVIKLVNILTCE